MGSLAVNYIRLIIALIFFTALSLIIRGMIVPVDASRHVWIWLFISGLVGFVIGDLFLFKAFVTIGARISMLIMSSVPPITALIGWWLLGETLTWIKMLGMGVTLAGISIVILEKEQGQKKLKLSKSVLGIFFAFIGSLGQAIGLVLSKFGMQSYNAFAATHIRIIAGVIGFSLLFTILNRWSRVKQSLFNRPALSRIALGAFFGPFIGVSLSLYAVQHIETGVASTLMALVPVIIILPSVFVMKEKITLKEVGGAIIAVSGVGLLFL